MHIKEFQSKISAQNKTSFPYLTLEQATLGVGGEVGEVIAILLGLAEKSGNIQELVKRTSGRGHPLDTVKVAGECVDVLVYIGCLADILNFDLEESVVRKLKIIDKRIKKGYYKVM